MSIVALNTIVLRNGIGNFDSLVLGMCSYSSLNSDWSSQCGKACCLPRHQQDEEESNGGKICSLFILKKILFECLSSSKILKGEQRGWETTNRGGPKFYQVARKFINSIYFQIYGNFSLRKGIQNYFYAITALLCIRYFQEGHCGRLENTFHLWAKSGLGQVVTLVV